MNFYVYVTIFYSLNKTSFKIDITYIVVNILIIIATHSIHKITFEKNKKLIPEINLVENNLSKENNLLILNGSNDLEHIKSIGFRAEEKNLFVSVISSLKDRIKTDKKDEIYVTKADYKIFQFKFNFYTWWCL